jgi:NADP-dependent 3-hydroxy acid dehydrogenase YdfG
MSKSVAIVTGARSGIGKATTLRLARDFEAVVLAARSGEHLREVGRQVKAIGADPAWSALKESKGAVVFISGNAAATPKAGAVAVGAINAAIEALAKAFALGLEIANKHFQAPLRSFSCQHSAKYPLMIL